MKLLDNLTKMPTLRRCSGTRSLKYSITEASSNTIPFNFNHIERIENNKKPKLQTQKAKLKNIKLEKKGRYCARKQASTEGQMPFADRA